MKDLKNRGCPVHGIGIQFHIDLRYNDALIAGFRANLKRYASIGLVAHVTELDVQCTPNDANNACRQGWNDGLRW